MLEDSLVLANLLTPSMVVGEERFTAGIITCEITKSFKIVCADTFHATDSFL